MPEYATAQEYRDYIPETDNQDNNADSIIELYLDEAEAFIDWYCGRHFGNSNLEDKTFWGEGITLLRVEPCYGRARRNDNSKRD